MKIKLFITFDHELPLGKIITSYDASLFAPTERILDLSNELGVKVTLFTDILCAQQFRKWDNENFFVPYKAQLQTFLNNGHDVQLHIHPHWLTTKFENGTFIPSNDFGLSDFNGNTYFGGVSGIIRKSIRDLSDICKFGIPDYKCIAFRAGGYNIAPATDQIFHALYDLGIRYDSSMARGYYFKSGISEVDFRSLPKNANWFVNPENYHTSSLTEGILEIPIATIPKSLFEIPTMFKMKNLVSRAPIKHGEVIHSCVQVDKTAKFKMLFASRMLSFDNYTLSLKYLMKILDYNIKKHGSEEALMLSVISHPKSMGDYSFELMKGFVSEVQNKYPDAEFLTYTQMNNSSNIFQ
jgi:hypothetical protein